MGKEQPLGGPSFWFEGTRGYSGHGVTRLCEGQGPQAPERCGMQQGLGWCLPARCAHRLASGQVGLCVYKQGRQIDLGNSLLFRESFSAWAVHQLPHKLLYLLLLTTHFSHAFAVMKTGWSTTL